MLLLLLLLPLLLLLLPLLPLLLLLLLLGTRECVVVCTPGWCRCWCWWWPCWLVLVLVLVLLLLLLLALLLDGWAALARRCSAEQASREEGGGHAEGAAARLARAWGCCCWRRWIIVATC